MGHASQIALGIAMAQPTRPVFCLDGDGASIMQMGNMAIVGQSGCGNLTHIAFEICEDAKTDRAYMEATYREAAEFCAMLCEEYDLPVESICSHAEGYKLHIASSHSDPTHWWKKFGYSMDDFRAEVRKIMEEKRG